MLIINYLTKQAIAMLANPLIFNFLLSNLLSQKMNRFGF
jgi:hypothetical protein